MCDYSIENIMTRPAAVGDHLVVTAFVNSLTRGFAAIGEPNCAVCLQAGTEIVFDDPDVHADHPLGLYEKRRFGGPAARFRQINQQSPYEHHDALEFPDGRVVLLTRLTVGQTMRVIQLPAQPLEEKPIERTSQTEHFETAVRARVVETPVDF